MKKVNPNKLLSSCMVLSLVLIGMVLDIFLNMFGLTNTTNIQTALENSQFLPREVTLGLIVSVFVLSGLLIIQLMQKMEIKTNEVQK